jgi:ABC-2 type transport system permease protein
LPVNFDAIYLQEGEEFGNQVYDKHYGDLWDIFERQNRVQALSAVLAPLSALRPLSMGLSGTDFAQHRDFAQAAEGYRRALVERLNLEMRDKAGKDGYDYLSDAEFWQSIPDFAYAAPGTLQVLGANRLNVVFLVLWFVTGCLAAIGAIGRMKAV